MNQNKSKRTPKGSLLVETFAPLGEIHICTNIPIVDFKL
jgi:hypothetical protein